MNNTNSKTYVFMGIVFIIVFIYGIQLFNLQIVNSDYKKYAKGNAFLQKTIYPQRGIIYDRNNKLLAANKPTYDIVFIPKEVQPFDTIQFCDIIGLTKEEFETKLYNLKYTNKNKRNPSYSTYTIQTLLTQLSDQDAAYLQEKLFKFPGFFLQKRTLRKYLYPNAGLLLGYVAELNGGEIEKDSHYIRGDYGGRSGLEKSYEKELRGVKGAEILLRDAHGRIKGKYENGDYDIPAESGKDLQLTLDIELQKYGEELMHNKIGCIVMIEPSSGEILALVSTPTYDPNLLVGREYSKNYSNLLNDPRKLLINRATQGVYPPGSTFKVAQGLTFLQEGAININSNYPCAHGYIPLGGKPKCHTHASPVNIIGAITTSCNAFFPYGLTNMLSNRTKYSDINEAFDVWNSHMHSMGLGSKLGTDIPFEKKGSLPTSEYYSRIYKTKDWKPTYIISTAIGQGEILVTPLQMANVAASVANRGYYYTPHLVKSIKDQQIDSIYTTKHMTTIEPQYYDIIIEGMAKAVTSGTCRRVNLGPEIEVCGKTGTVENPHGKDHSLFMGFAPKDNPSVAIFVLLENGGFGAQGGVPIARLMLEKYLSKEKLEKDKVLEDHIKSLVIENPSYITASLKNKL